MALFLAPVCQGQAVDVDGNPRTGGKIYTYLAGTSTPTATYTTEAGSTPHANPIILNSLGQTPNPIWITSGLSYKFVETDSADVVIRTTDNIDGVNDTTQTASEWFDSGFTPTYISATSFSVPGDQTSTLQIGRRLKTTNTGGAIYSTITNSVYGALTTVTVTNDSGTLDAGLSVVAYGLLSATNPSVPATYVRTGLATASGLTMSTARMLGRTTASTGAIEEKTAAEVTAFLTAATTTAQGASELATTAETQTGSDAARTVTPAGLKGALLFSKGFESSDQTVTANSKLTIAHGLGAKPKIFQTFLKCNTAEANYTAGDEIEFTNMDVAGVSTCSTSVDATNMYIVHAGALRVNDKNTPFTAVTITPGNWRWVLRAWA